MICENCGKVLDKDEKICSICGTAIREDGNISNRTDKLYSDSPMDSPMDSPVDSSKNYESEASYKKVKKSTGKRKRGRAVIRCFLLFVIIVFLFAFFINWMQDIYLSDSNYDNITDTGSTESITEYQSKYTIIDVSPIKENNITINKAKIDVYKGSITEEEQIDEYSFTVPRDGRYRFELSEIYSGTSVNLKLKNSFGETISSKYGAENGDGITVKDLKANENYTIQVIQNTGTGSYILSIGNQKGTIDVSDKTSVVDSVEFTDQSNIYKFVVPRDGIYHFELAEVYSGTNFDVIVFNHLGETLGTNYGAGNKDGITIKDLKEGEECTIQIRQSTNLGSYQLCIGFQKETIEVLPNTIINDSIQYEDQCNVYSFNCENSMSNTVTITGLDDSCSVDLKAFNYLGEKIMTNYGAGNGDTIEISEDCTIQVVQVNGTGNYSITID